MGKVYKFPSARVSPATTQENEGTVVSILGRAEEGHDLDDHELELLAEMQDSTTRSTVALHAAEVRAVLNPVEARRAAARSSIQDMLIDLERVHGSAHRETLTSMWGLEGAGVASERALAAHLGVPLVRLGQLLDEGMAFARIWFDVDDVAIACQAAA